MAGVQVEVEVAGLSHVMERLRKLGGNHTPKVLAAIGAEVETQTRRRISSEKTAPDGSAWKPWSEDYAATRHGNQSLLEGEGMLLDSINFRVHGNEVEVGSGLVYAAIQQFGGAEVGIDIPARPYLGLSPQNQDDVLAVVADYFERVVRE